MKRVFKALAYFFVVLIFAFLLAWMLSGFYRKEIVTELNRQLAEAMNAHVQIGDADLAFLATFPSLSIRLEDVYIRETEKSPHDILRSERVYFTIDFFPLLKGEVHFKSLRIHHTEILVYRSKSGRLNLEKLGKGGASDSTKAKILLNLTHGELICQDLQLTFRDSLRRKNFAVNLQEVTSQLILNDTVFAQRLTGRVFFDGLTFNANRGTFLHSKATEVDIFLRHPRNTPYLFIDSSFVQLEKSRLMVTGSVNTPDSGRVRIHIHSNRLDYQEGLSVLPEKLATRLKVMEVKQPFVYSIDIDAALGVAADPLLDMKFSFHQNQVTSKKISIEEVSLTGTFTNHLDSLEMQGDRNSEIHLSNVEGHLNELPFQAEAWLTDLTELQLRLDTRHEFKAGLLNRITDSTQLRITAGDVTSAVHYEGELAEYLDDSVITFSGKLSGQTELKDVAFTWIPRKLSFKKVNALADFNQDTVWLKRLAVTSGTNELHATGTIHNYVPFFTQPSQKGYVKLDIHSPAIDLSTLLVKRTKKKATSKQKREVRKKVSALVHQIFSNMEFQISLDVDHLRKQNFSASNLTGLLQLRNNELSADKMKMKFGGGELDASFLMKNLDKEISPIYLTAYTTHVNIKQLFKAFDNFQQNAITSQHLEGTISSSVKLGAKINDNFEFERASLWGPVRVTIKKGKINNLPAFQKLSTFLLKRRDFEHMQFAQIDGRLFIKGREIEVERMEVQSNVLGLFLEGIYSTRNKTDLTIQIPLSNLKKRDRKFVPKKVGTDAKVGPSVFLKAKANEKGETEISYDLFHKFRKKK